MRDFHRNVIRGKGRTSLLSTAMTRVLSLLLAATAMLVAGSTHHAVAGSDAGDTGNGAPVVVELFSSQGCSSCPPAEAYLRDLANRDDVIALEFHVDYWDYLGWSDTYADPAFTDRQRRYVETLGSRYVYTPQMVVDGAVHEVGSRRSKVEKLIERSKGIRDDRPVIEIVSSDPDMQKVDVTIVGPVTDMSYDILMVTFDDRLLTKVKRGENRGKTLENRNVVRSITKIGEWKGGELIETIDLGGMPGTAGCVVLIQQPGGGPILAAAKLGF